MKRTKRMLAVTTTLGLVLGIGSAALAQYFVPKYMSAHIPGTACVPAEGATVVYVNGRVENRTLFAQKVLCTSHHPGIADSYNLWVIDRSSAQNVSCQRRTYTTNAPNTLINRATRTTTGASTNAQLLAFPEEGRPIHGVDFIECTLPPSDLVGNASSISGFEHLWTELVDAD